jgi:hypothetical protein
MRVKSFEQAVRLANSAGLDAAKRRMRKAGREVMSAADYDHAASVTERMLTELGFDVPGWIAAAGVPRNEPPAPPTRKKPRRRRQDGPVQLAFAFS